MNSQPSHEIVGRNNRLVPRADGDAAAAARVPFILFGGPKNQALVRLDVPLAESAIGMYGRGSLRGWAVRDGISGTIRRTVFTSHAEISHPKGDWFVRLKRQIGCDPFKSHVV